MHKNPYYSGPKSDHFDGLRFFGPGGARDKSLGELASMLWRSRREAQTLAALAPVLDGGPPPRAVKAARSGFNLSAIRASSSRPRAVICSSIPSGRSAPDRRDSGPNA